MHCIDVIPMPKPRRLTPSVQDIRRKYNFQFDGNPRRASTPVDELPPSCANQFDGNPRRASPSLQELRRKHNINFDGTPRRASPSLQELRRKHNINFDGTPRKPLHHSSPLVPACVLPHTPVQRDVSPPTPSSPLVRVHTVKRRRPITNDGAPAAKRRHAYWTKTLLAELKEHPGDEGLLVSALGTPAGRAAYPLLSKVVNRPGQEHQTLQANVSSLLGGAGRQHKARIAHILCENLPQTFCTEMLGLSKSFALYAARHTQGNPKGSQDIVIAQYPTGTSRTNMCEEEESILMKFFQETTIVYSGTKTSLRTLPCDEWQWKVELYAEFPRLLRLFALAFPRVLEPTYGATKNTKGGDRVLGWTAFKANILAAVAQGWAVGFDPDKELRDRRTAATARYDTSRARLSGQLPPETAEEKETRKEEKARRTLNYASITTFLPTGHEVRPCDFGTFKDFLKRRNCRFTTHEKAHPCNLCEEGPLLELALPVLTTRAAYFTALDQEVPPQLRQQIRTTTTKLSVYRLHKAQLETGRRELNKRATNLLPGEAVILRDFVNHHDLTGKKINCLHWVIQWRTSIGGPLLLLKLRHYCSDNMSQSCSAHYNADVEAFHFKPESAHNPGLFMKMGIHKVYIGGDHGPHFSCFDSLYHEASCKSKYGVEVELMWLTSYHAYNRCDGAGAEDSTSHNTDTRGGLPREGAAAWTDMTNESNDQRSWAFHFLSIAQNTDTFPKDLNRTIKHVKKWSHVIFLDHDSGPGLLKYRLVSGEGNWTYADLHPAARADGPWLCASCSTKACSQVFHELESTCPSPEDCHTLPFRFVPVVPDPDRIEGEQIRRGAAARKKPKAIKYPCKFGCTTTTGKPKSTRSIAAANKHMEKKHSGEATYMASRYTETVEPPPPPIQSSLSSSSSSCSRVPPPLPPNQSSLSSSSSSRPSPPSNQSSSSSSSSHGLPAEGLPPTRRRKNQKRTDKQQVEATDEESQDEESEEEESKEEESEEEEDTTSSEVDEEEEDEEATFEIEKIVDHRDVGAKGDRDYYVKWKGVRTKTWEQRANLVSCKKVMKEYNATIRRKR
jgi:hypothetical protein